MPDSVLQAYGLDSLKFGLDYLIPKPLDPRVLLWEAPGVAEAAIQTGVARQPLDLAEYREQLAARLGSGRRIRRFIINKAKATPWGQDHTPGSPFPDHGYGGLHRFRS